jgi:hypothetical protein
MALSRITANSIADGTVVAADIADGSITTAKIADANVTNSKLAGSITSDKITSVSNTAISGVIITSQLANNLTVNASSIISSANIDFKVGASQNTAVKIASNENLQFNSGYGSVATAYGCRAWVNFDGRSTPSIRGSGNVSSITDEGPGEYTINFTAAIVDANYSITANIGYFPTIDGNNVVVINTDGAFVPSTTAFRIRTFRVAGGDNDSNYVMCSVFR